MIFEDAGWTLDEISSELVQSLPHELGDPYGPDRPWTKAVKSGLFSMGEKRGMMVCCHDSPHNGEWMLDVNWMVRERLAIPLAVESEWGRPEAIEDDFDKLMSIKSRHKLLLFATKIDKSADVVGVSNATCWHIRITSKEKSIWP